MAEFLSDRIADTLGNEILALDYGDMLPSERKLVEKYKVSRNCIREVLKSFEDRGLIEIIPGKGARKINGTSKIFSRALEDLIKTTGTGLKDLIDARESIEIQIFYKAAQRASIEDFDNLIMMCNQMDKLTDPIEYNKKDIEFHLAIAKISKNPVMMFLLNSLYEISDKFFFLITKFSPDSIASAQNEHRALIEAMKDKNMIRIVEIAHLHFEDILSLVTNIS